MSKQRHQLIHTVHHNKAKWHQDWFGKSQCVLSVEKVRTADGRVVKRVLKTVDPTVRYYVTKPEHQEEHVHQEPSYPMDRCDSYESRVEFLDKDVAELTGQMDYYNETKGPGASRRRRLLHDNQWVHGSDVNLVDHYMDRYMEHYKDVLDTTSPLELAFADIEVDPVDHRGFPDEFEAPVPVSLITYFHGPTKMLRQYALRNTVRANPLIEAFEQNLDAELVLILAAVNRAPLEKAGLVQPECPVEDVARALGYDPETGEEVDAMPEAWEKARCMGVDVQFFDDEGDLICAFLNQVNEVDRPDVILFWNMCFDANTLMNRLAKLGFDPEVEFTPKDFRPWCMASYDVDRFNTEPTDRSDIFTVTGYTLWVDQMLLYAQLRKQAGKKESYSLDFTLRAELKENKLEYEGSIRDLAYRDYRQFMHYGALDVVPMATLEEKLEDVAQAYQLSMVTRTRFHKIMKKTVCLRNLAAVFYRNRGLALSNNHNRNKERTDSEQFQGAYVADPKLLKPVGALIGGNRSDRVFETVVDFDATSLYPSIILATNIDASGQVGRLALPDPETGAFRDSSHLMTAWASGDYVEVGREWFGMPGTAELLSIISNASQEVSA